MKQNNQKLIIYLVNVLIIASLISSTIYFYNKSNSLSKELQILGNIYNAEKERQIGIAVGERISNHDFRW